MSPIKCMLLSLLGKRSNLVKYLSAKVNQRYAFLPTSKIVFNEHAIEIKMPSLSPTMTERSIASIKKEVPVSNHPKKDFPKLCGPSVKKLLAEYGIKFSDVPSSGPRDNLLKGDVLNYILDKRLLQISRTIMKTNVPSKPDIKIVKTKSHDDVPISSLRRTVAQQLTLSKTTIPHAYMNVDCKIDKIFDYKKKLEQGGFNVSLDDFLIKSAATALRKVPEMNIFYLNGQVKSLESINISITTAKDSGYVSSVVKDADGLTVQHISEQINSIVEQTEEWKLENEKFQSGSFRISNLGLFGVSEFSAVIYPPEVAVLAVGAVRSVFEEKIPTKRMRMTLSFNNELISENVAGSFMNVFKECLENPLSVCLT